MCQHHVEDHLTDGAEVENEDSVVIKLGSFSPCRRSVESPRKAPLMKEGLEVRSNLKNSKALLWMKTQLMGKEY